MSCNEYPDVTCILGIHVHTVRHGTTTTTTTTP